MGAVVLVALSMVKFQGCAAVQPPRPRERVVLVGVRLHVLELAPPCRYDRQQCDEREERTRHAVRDERDESEGARA
eukprot:scaffold67846_cov60-Phaeocystis_antarctica.AAC.3